MEKQKTDNYNLLSVLLNLRYRYHVKTVSAKTIVFALVFFLVLVKTLFQVTGITPSQPPVIVITNNINLTLYFQFSRFNRS